MFSRVDHVPFFQYMPKDSAVFFRFRQGWCDLFRLRVRVVSLFVQKGVFFFFFSEIVGEESFLM